jgi:hypothetical protein
MGTRSRETDLLFREPGFFSHANDRVGVQGLDDSAERLFGPGEANRGFDSDQQSGIPSSEGI